MAAYLEDLNVEQFEAVTTTEGFLRVIAGAGSGKTKALAARFAYLVDELGILPCHILCVTFTNKAAAEMRRRIHNLIGDMDTGYINTFHGFCVSVLQEDIYAIQYPKSFLVLDNSDIDDMLRIIYEERQLSLRDMTFADARDLFEMRKTVLEPGYYLDMIGLSAEELKKKYEQAAEVKDILFYGYLYQQRKCYGLDYNDLIILTLYIFEQVPEIRRKWQERLEYIMIDEFQDIDPLQVRLMEVLSAYHKNLFVVGDPDQTIYSWRGADIRYLTEFDLKHPKTKTVMMNTNYRSTPQILAAVNSLIAKNKQRIPKELVPVREDGPAVRADICSDPEQEAAWVADRIEELREQGVTADQIAVLYRAHYLTRSIEAELTARQMPYTLYSGVGFFDRAEIKDALAYLRMVAYQDDLSFRRIANQPKRNLGVKRMKYLEECAENEHITLYQALQNHLDEDLFKNTKAAAFIRLIRRFNASYPGKSISKLLAELLQESGYEAMLRTEGDQLRLDHLAELRQAVLQYEIGCGEECELPDFLSHAALLTDADAACEGEKLKLMTVHAAKGLEFPYVFLLGLNEGIFPGRRTETYEGMEEERRLCFVAMTRAKNGLFLSASEGRIHDGSPRYMSRFLLDMDPGLVIYDTEPREELVADSRQYIHASGESLAHGSCRPMLRIGDRVRHSVLGPGIVKDIDAKRNAYMVQFAELETVRAISFRARLEKTD